MEEQYQGAFLAASVRLFDVWGRARQTYFSLYGVFTSVFFGAIFFFAFLLRGPPFCGGPHPSCCLSWQQKPRSPPPSQATGGSGKVLAFSLPWVPVFLGGSEGSESGV